MWKKNDSRFLYLISSLLSWEKNADDIQPAMLQDESQENAYESNYSALTVVNNDKVKQSKHSNRFKNSAHGKELNTLLRTHTVARYSKTLFDEKSCECNKCGKRFQWDDGLKRHMRIHFTNILKKHDNIQKWNTFQMWSMQQRI